MSGRASATQMSSTRSSPSEWETVRKYHKTSVDVGLGLEASRARHAAAEEHAEGVVFNVTDTADLKAIDKYHQANEEMNTLEAWEKRFALRREPAVRELLHTGWWMTALRTLKAQEPENEFPQLDKLSYFRIYKLLFRSLAKEMREKYDEEEACECAEEDWEADSRDGVSMPRELFMDALFQIADLYTETASSEEYASFLQRILQRCIAKGTDLASGTAVFWKTKPKKPPKPPKKAKTPTPPPEPSKSPSPPPLPKTPPPEEPPPPPTAAEPPAAEPSSTPPPPTPSPPPLAPPKEKKPKAKKPVIVVAKRPEEVRERREKVALDDTEVWHTAGPGGEQFGKQPARMEWGDRKEELEASASMPHGIHEAAWKSGTGFHSLEDGRFDAMDWGEREEEKEEAFVLKSPRRSERKAKRKVQRRRKATVKVQAQQRAKAKQKKFQVAKEATVCLQAHARRNSAAALLAQFRAAAIMLQARARGQRIRELAKPPKLGLKWRSVYDNLVPEGGEEIHNETLAEAINSALQASLAPTESPSATGDKLQRDSNSRLQREAATQSPSPRVGKSPSPPPQRWLPVVSGSHTALVLAPDGGRCDMAAASRSLSPTKMLGGSRLSPTEHQKTAPSPPPVPKLLTVELILRTWQALGMKRALKENEYIRVDEKIFVPVDPDAPPPPPPPAPPPQPTQPAAAPVQEPVVITEPPPPPPPPPEPVPEPEPPPPLTPEPPPPPKFHYMLPELPAPSPRQRGPLDRVKSPIYVKSLTGSTHEFDVTGADNVRALKQMITSRVGTPPEQFRLIYEDQILRDDGKTLSEYDVEKQSILRCSPEMSEQCWSLPSTPPGPPLPPPRWIRPKPLSPQAHTLSDLQPAPLPYPRPSRRTGDWSGISASWESDGAANSVQMRLRRENQQLVTFPDSWSNTASFVSDAYVPDLHSLLSSTSTLQLTPTRRRSLRPSHENERQEQRSREKLKPLKPMDKKVIRSQIKRLGRTMPSSVSLPALLPPASRLDAIGPGSSPSARETSLEANKPFSFFGPVKPFARQLAAL